MKKRKLWMPAFVLLAFLFATSCATVPDKPPRLTCGGKYLEDRSTGDRYKFNKHYGIDYYTAPGTPIIAAADGSVEQIFNMDNIFPEF